MRRILLVALTVALASLMISPGYADPPQDRPNSDGAAIDDYGTLLLNDQVAAATMTDTLQEALLGGDCGTIDCGPPPPACTYLPLDDRSSGPAPADAYQWQAIYFLPSDATFHPWSKPVGCSDGSWNESNIGWGIHNTRAWMSGHSSNAAMSGKAFSVLTKTYSAYSRSWTRYDVMYFRAPAGHDTAYFASDPLNRIRDDLNAKGFNQAHVKYVVWADVLIPAQSAGNCRLGTAYYNGNKGAVYRRCSQPTGNSAERWGCADTGDVAAMHEAVHEWGTVNPLAADYDTVDNQKHVLQNADLMHSTVMSTLSGIADGGGTLTAQTVWDDGAESYTNRVLSYPAYITSFSTNAALKRCNNS